jgi:hypothetical protein
MSAPKAQGGRWAVWTAGLVVVAAAGAATAHGLYEVALGSGTPAGIAWLYPVITDGLALVAYAATTRLTGPGRRYAWAVVVLAAGLSGLAQATYLAGSVGTAPTGLRFGVGAWPAIAAAIAAHLLFLIGSEVERVGLQLDVPLPLRPTVERAERPSVQIAVQPGVQADQREITEAGEPGINLNRRERALDTARRHQRHHGVLPSVRELEIAARVSRGTAHTALQELRAAANGRPTASDAADNDLEGPTP